MRLALLGVRGSTPATGADFIRYGGNTSCVAVLNGDVPHLLIDAGTGLTRLPGLLNGQPFHGTVILGHLHWDHTHGLPFCGSVNNPEASTRVLVPSQDGPPEQLLARAIGPPHFPVEPHELTGDWSFANIDAGEHELEGLRVTAIDVPHPGGRMLAYRITDGKVSFSYVSDHSPIDTGPGPQGFGEYHDAIKQLATGVDLLIHDAQYTAAEFPARKHYGHSTFDYALGLARECSVPRLLLFHHDPWRRDDALDELGEWAAERAPEGSSVSPAIEGEVIEVGA